MVAVHGKTGSQGTSRLVEVTDTAEVIQIWAAGGPPHLDTFDPKPDAGHDYCGPLTKPIQTNVDGIRIGELLPLLAKQADKYSIIRSMTHGNNGHETAAYLTQTGRRPGDRLVYPCAGAVVSLFKGYTAGYKGLLPPYVVLTQSQGRFSEAGFLGPRCLPFATGGDPSQPRFMVEGVVSQGISDQQQKDRRDLLGKLDTFGRSAKGNTALATCSWQKLGARSSQGVSRRTVGRDHVLPPSAERMSSARPPRGASMSVGMPIFFHSSLAAGFARKYAVGGDACQ